MVWTRPVRVPKKGMESPDASLEKEAERPIPVPPKHARSKRLMWAAVAVGLAVVILIVVYLLLRG